MIEFCIIQADDIKTNTISELKNCWDNKLLLSRANDYTVIKNPEINYGFFGKFRLFNNLPDKIKRIFRIFGRNNSLYQINSPAI